MFSAHPDCDTKLFGPSYPDITKLNIIVNGVEKLLAGINPSKATSPDQIPCRILKEFSHELAPMLIAAFRQSLQHGKLPSSWLRANVAPIFKKAVSCVPENYGLGSLICISFKIMEHIICYHIRAYLDKHGVYHGYNMGSMPIIHESQFELLTTLRDLFTTQDAVTQIDIAMLDFSKAFDKVPHKWLRSKFQSYGISGSLYTWMQVPPSGRTLQVVVEGQYSEEADVRLLPWPSW